MKSCLILLLSIVAAGCSRPAGDETAAIRHLQPYSRVLISTADGKFLDVPPALLVAPSASMGQGGTSVNTNYRMNIAGSTAWVSHDEEPTAKNGQKSYSTEIRLLEKLDGQWKPVGQFIHLHGPQ